MRSARYPGFLRQCLAATIHLTHNGDILIRGIWRGGGDQRELTRQCVRQSFLQDATREASMRHHQKQLKTQCFDVISVNAWCDCYKLLAHFSSLECSLCTLDSALTLLKRINHFSIKPSFSSRSDNARKRITNLIAPVTLKE